MIGDDFGLLAELRNADLYARGHLLRLTRLALSRYSSHAARGMALEPVSHRHQVVRSVWTRAAALSIESPIASRAALIPPGVGGRNRKIWSSFILLYPLDIC